MAGAAASDLELDELDERERAAVEALCFRLADDELVLAERYTEWQVRAPTLESDIALANVAQDELGHARLWYGLLERLGYDEPELIWERDPGDFRHATLAELPFETGDWADAIVRGYLYDVAEELRLDAIGDSSVPAIRERVPKVREEEEYHLEHAWNWLERLVEDDAERDGPSDGRERVQAAVDRLYPHALTLFEPVGKVEDEIDTLAVRTRSLDELREAWRSRVEGALTDLGLDVPDADPADPAGRDGAHTDHWPELHAEMTETYRELERDRATRIMDADDD